MTLSTRIAPHLLYLRRFARAVTGSQTSGDAYVTSVLESIIEDISIFPEASSDKVALYQIFASLFKTTDLQLKTFENSFAWERGATANLAALATLPRQAFVLVSVEGFTHQEGAEILRLDEVEFSKLLKSAVEDIAKQIATEILIIEDEPLIAMDIEQMVQSLGHKVVGIARTRDEAVEMFNKENPKMVLADIQLADGSSGIDAVNDILKHANVPVIFITAFPERLLTGEKPEPAFLVTKPFNPNMVKALISQALFFAEKRA